MMQEVLGGVHVTKNKLFSSTYRKHWKFDPQINKLEVVFIVLHLQFSMELLITYFWCQNTGSLIPPKALGQKDEVLGPIYLYHVITRTTRMLFVRT